MDFSIIFNYSFNMLQWRIFEEGVRSLVEDCFKTKFPKDGFVDIQGKIKKFDYVNLEKNIVGDSKHYSFTQSGKRPSAKFSTLNEYIWLLQKLPTGWRKFMVIGEDESLVRKYVNEFAPWLEKVTIFFSDGRTILREIKK